MKKGFWIGASLAILFFGLTGVSEAWEGRMLGMGSPHSLIADESDFLIHPAGIIRGEGVRLYSNYQFKYTEVTNWDSSRRFYAPSPVGGLPAEGGGDEIRHDALLGGSFPLGPGRMGVFFGYDYKEGDYDGELGANLSGLISLSGDYELETDSDAFLLRILYGLPMECYNLGGEIQFAYREEEKETWLAFGIPGLGGIGLKNGPASFLLPFMTPYDSEFWEVLFKGSIDGALGCAPAALTVSGGFIFAGDNEFDFGVEDLGVGSMMGVEMDKDVKGWQAGADFWLRYPLAQGLSAPFVLRAKYQKKERDGAGNISIIPLMLDYENEEERIEAEAGGGLEKDFGSGSRIAAGIYYAFFDNRSDFLVRANDGSGWFNLLDHNDFFPDQTEHQAVLKIAGERKLAPAAAVLRGGINFFYGWINEDLDNNIAGLITNDISNLTGHRWGVSGSLGGSLEVRGLILEPFVNGGYQEHDLDGDGWLRAGGSPIAIQKMEKDKNEWFIGGGFSVLFNLL